MKNLKVFMLILIMCLSLVTEVSFCADTSSELLNILAISGGETATNLVYTLKNNTIISYYYDTSIGVKSATQTILANTNSTPTTDLSYNGKYTVFGSGKTVYVFTTNVKKADWSKNFNSDIKQVEIVKNFLVVRTELLIDIYNLPEILPNKSSQAIYTSNVKPAGPFLVFEDYIYFEYQENAAWNLRKIDLAGKTVSELKGELSGAILEKGQSVYDGVLYYVTNGNAAHAINSKTLTKLWSVSFVTEALGPTTRPEIGVDASGGINVFVGTQSGDVYKIVTGATVTMQKIFGSKSPVKDISIVNIKNVGYVIFAIYSNGIVNTHTSNNNEKGYTLNSEIVDVAKSNANVYLAIKNDIINIPVSSIPLGGIEQVSLLNRPIIPPNVDGGLLEGGWLIYIIMGGVLVLVLAGGIIMWRRRGEKAPLDETEELKDLFK